jgi:membrane protein DedA with SNARE-associated domain
MLGPEFITHGYAWLFLGVFVEADAALVGGAFLAHRGYFDLRAVIVLSILATALANQGWFWLGRHRGRAYLERTAASNPGFSRLNGWIQRRGTLLIPLSRFVFGLRATIPAAYGAAGTAPAVFTRLDVPSAAAWGLLVGTLGYLGGGAIERVQGRLEHAGALLAGMALTAAVVYLPRRVLTARPHGPAAALAIAGERSPDGLPQTAFSSAALAWRYGHDSMSYFAKQDDKRHFSVDGRAFLAFRLKHRVAVVAGDPIGEEDAVGPLIGQFIDYCAANGWVPTFYEVSPRYLEAYHRNGLRSFKIGEEALLNLPTWSLSGGAVAKVRQFVNKVHREAPDLRVAEYRRLPAEPGVDEQLEDISRVWLSTKKGGEMGFNLGQFSLATLSDKRTLIARRDDGTVEAFVTWLPYREGRALVLDAMRYRPTAPAGVMDLLIAESALHFKREGAEAVSLAMAPLANADPRGPLTRYDRVVRTLFEHFSQVYGYRTLFQYKKKFAPSWEPRYLVFTRPDHLWRVVWALVSVHYGH